MFTSSSANIAALQDAAAPGLITLEPIPDARRVYFAHAQYDADFDRFDADFPGRTDVNLLSEGIFAVVFKAWPEKAWVDAIQKAGLQPVAPIQSMAWLVYGPRTIAAGLPRQFGAVYKVMELPGGLKRFNLDTRQPGDGDEPQWTYVHVVASASSIVRGLLLSGSGMEPVLIDRSATTVSFSSMLTRAEAINLASFPEVISVRRMPLGAGPSDERSNRIAGGTFATPGTSYAPPPLPNNTGANYWTQYLASLAALGIDPANEVIGMLDTGVDAGLRENGAAYCPRFLRSPLGCRLVFTTDTTLNQPVLDARGDDYLTHGTLVASILASYANTDSPGRDGDNYAFSQGVASGARLALSKFWTDCNTGPSFRIVGGVSLSDLPTRLRFSIVALSTALNLPDGSGLGPAATLFNHSWHTGDPSAYAYDESAVILDRATRRLNYYSFTFDGGQTIVGADGQPRESLHVVAAGNDFNLADQPVQAPGTARNVITVGASETYNQMAYGTGGCTALDTSLANDPRQIPAFSGTGWTFNRAKPDLVAPGTRSYGGRSEAASRCFPDCNEDLLNSGSGPRYQWSTGTSFSAPVVTGAAALVRQWITPLLLGATPSPALVKATLLNATTNLAPCNPACPGCTTCGFCGTTLPRPDRHQGWGGLALDKLFGPSSNYYFLDEQPVPFTANGQGWSRRFTVVDYTRPIEVTLAWTDAVTIANMSGAEATLVNDLDLEADLGPGPGGSPAWAGNYYYSCPTCCGRTGYSISQSGTLVYDHKNNVERISFPAYTFPNDGFAFFIRVTATSLQGDGINPSGNTPRQDFALAVINAH